MKWPRKNDDSIWKVFEDKTNNVFKTALTAMIRRKVETFTTIIYSVDRETFGTEEIKVKTI